MRFLKKDLKPLKLFKPTFTPDGNGDEIVSYDVPIADFYGNIQPFSEKLHREAYGIDLEYAYVVYAPLDCGFTELDHIYDGNNWYEIKNIQQWPKSYCRLTVEKVMR